MRKFGRENPTRHLIGLFPPYRGPVSQTSYSCPHAVSSIFQKRKKCFCSKSNHLLERFPRNICKAIKLGLQNALSGGPGPGPRYFLNRSICKVQKKLVRPSDIRSIVWMAVLKSTNGVFITRIYFWLCIKEWYIIFVIEITAGMNHSSDSQEF